MFQIFKSHTYNCKELHDFHLLINILHLI
jgi:hypothetical protein